MQCHNKKEESVRDDAISTCSVTPVFTFFFFTAACTAILHNNVFRKYNYQKVNVI